MILVSVVLYFVESIVPFLLMPPSAKDAIDTMTHTVITEAPACVLVVFMLVSVFYLRLGCESFGKAELSSEL